MSSEQAPGSVGIAAQSAPQPLMSLQEGDQAAAAVAVAPRVTLADLEALIQGEYTFTAGDATDALDMPTMEEARLLTICVCVLTNGWTIVGKSAAASPANFNRDLGRRLAREDAIRQMWPLEGYLLRQRLHEERAGQQVS